MKSKVIAVAVILFLPVMVWDGSPAYGRGGGGHGGGGGFHGGAGFRGGGFRGSSFSAGNRSHASGNFAPRYSGAVVNRYSAAGVSRYSGAGPGRYSAAGGTRSNNFAAANVAQHRSRGSVFHNGGNVEPDRGAPAMRGNSGHSGNWARNHPANNNRFGWQTQQRLRNWQGRRSNF